MLVHINDMTMDPTQCHREQRLIIRIDDVFPVGIIHPAEMPTLIVFDIIIQGVIIL